MYLVGQGHNHYGPGTSMVQRVKPAGLGLYVSGVGSPSVGTAMVQRLTGRPAGLGCACDGNQGLGLFDSGLDLSGWGAAEWGVAGLGAFALFSMFSTTRRGVRSARRTIGARRTRSKRRAQLRRQLEES